MARIGLRSFVLALCMFTSVSSFGQEGWAFDTQRSFIKNEGQFDGRNWQKDNPILYGMSQNPFYIFFSKKGHTYRFDRLIKNPNRKNPQVDSKRINVSELVHVTWLNANSNVEVIVEDVHPSYYSYAILKPGTKDVYNVNHIKGYQKLIYKNLYNYIDVEYNIHPEGGVKYNVILHPGANPADLRMKYTSGHTTVQDEFVKIQLNNQGQLEINTSLGSIVEHAPFTFVNSSGQEIKSRYVFKDNVLSFALDNYDNSQMVTIDPWIVSPNYTTSSAVWEVEADAAGNVYAIGGETPMELKKYNAAGTLQWTYVTPWDTSTVWLGTLATDELGNSFVTSGTSPTIQRINTTGAMVYSVSHTGTFGSESEFWSISFNCDKTKLIVGGTKANIGLFINNFFAAIFEIDINNGSILNEQTFAQTTIDLMDPASALNPPVEVRSVASSKNSKYVFLTHYDVGLINDDLDLCPDGAIYQVPNQRSLGYKCENFLPSTQNGGGLKALVANDDFFYTHSGNQLRQWNIVNGSLVNMVTIPGGGSFNTFLGGSTGVENSGLAVDACGNVYVGSKNQVIKYDQNLNVISSSPTTFTIYDVAVRANGEVVVCGAQQANNQTNRNGRIESINMSACAQYEITCCNASFCNPGVLCVNDPSVTLTVATPGGVWSGPGVSSAGVFNPAAAGPGTHTITYTLACGEDTQEFIVSPCQPLEACLNTDGSITVSNGIATYTWEQTVPPSSTPITNQAQCEGCGYTWFAGFPPLVPSQCLDGATQVTTCNSPGGFVQFATGTTVMPGTFPIRVTDATGVQLVINSINDLAECVEEPCPTITVTSSNQNNVTCFGGNNGTATVSASGGATPYTYNWMPGNLSGATQSQLTAGTYTVTATDLDGCTGQVVVTITQPTQLTATIAATDATCGANDGQLQVNPNGGTAPYTYVWTPNVGSTATVSNLAAGSYQVVVTDAAGCSITLNGNINNANAPTLTLVSSENESCPGDADGSATVSASGGSGGYSFTWSPTGGNAAAATGLSAGNYVVTVTDSDGCQSSLNVTIGSQPAIILSGTVINEDCGQQNGQISLNASGGTGTLTYSWSNGQSTSSLINLPFGDYTVVVTDQNGCSTQQTFTVETIGTIPVFVTPPVASIEAGESIELEATGGVSYTWAPPTGLSCTDCPNPTASPITTTTYTVSAVDEFGCQGDTTVTIFVQQLCGELFVPTIFSPNADGSNDQHCVLGGCLTNFEFSIYNRWGERVFESNSQSACWDGMFRGKPAQTGVYVYKLKAVLIDGTEVKESGNINLVR